MANYTITEIKRYIEKLMMDAMSETRLDINKEALNKIDDSNELALEISEYNQAVTTVNEIYIKHVKGRSYYSKLNCPRKLEEVIKQTYIDSQKHRIENVKNQFTVILSKVSLLRTPAKALEFLKIFDIEMPKESVKEEIPMNVDIDFIKSLLPKNKLLTDGAQRGNE